MLRKGLVLLLFPILLGGWSVATLAEDMNVDSASWTKQYDPIFKNIQNAILARFMTGVGLNLNLLQSRDLIPR